MKWYKFNQSIDYREKVEDAESRHLVFTCKILNRIYSKLYNARIFILDVLLSSIL